MSNIQTLHDNSDTPRHGQTRVTDDAKQLNYDKRGESICGNNQIATNQAPDPAATQNGAGNSWTNPRGRDTSSQHNGSLHAGDDNTWQDPEAMNEAEQHNGHNFSQNASGGDKNLWNGPTASDNAKQHNGHEVSPNARAGRNSSWRDTTAMGNSTQHNGHVFK